MDAPAPPPAAESIFGDRLPLALEYAALLAGDAVVRGFIGPQEAPRLWSRHILNCAVVGELIAPLEQVGAGSDGRAGSEGQQGVQVIDVGSGAGLPGIPLALARPDLRLTLVEPLERRSAWLTQVVSQLGLSRVRVVRGRAEDLHGSLRAPYVTARAVAPMGRLARWCLPLLTPGGLLLALKGRAASEELDQASAELRRLGARDWQIRSAGTGELTEPTSVVVVRSR